MCTSDLLGVSKADLRHLIPYALACIDGVFRDFNILCRKVHLCALRSLWAPCLSCSKNQGLPVSAPMFNSPQTLSSIILSRKLKHIRYLSGTICNESQDCSWLSPFPVGSVLKRILPQSSSQEFQQRVFTLMMSHHSLSVHPGRSARARPGAGSHWPARCRIVTFITG